MRQQKYLERERERICSGPVFLTYTDLQSETFRGNEISLPKKKIPCIINSYFSFWASISIRNAWQVIKIMRSTESVIYSDLGFTA